MLKQAVAAAAWSAEEKMRAISIPRLLHTPCAASYVGWAGMVRKVRVGPAMYVHSPP